MSRHNRALSIAAVLAALVVTALALHARRGATATVPSPDTMPAPRVQTATVRLGAVDRQIHGEGHVVAAAGGSAQLSFPEAGRIAAIVARVGQRVSAGQEIAQLDLSTVGAAAQGNIDPLAVQERAARDRLAIAKQQLERAERLADARGNADEMSPEAAQVREDAARVSGDRATLAREQTLFEGGVAARKDVDAARQQLALDEAALAADRAKLPDPLTQAKLAYAQAVSDAAASSAALTLARRGRANAVLRSTIDGIVTAVDKDPGEWADAGVTVATVVNPSSAQLSVALPGDQAALVEPGDLVRADGATGRVLRVIHPLDPTTQMGQAIVAFSETPPAALGAVLPVDIQTGVRRGVTLVPATSIVQDPESGDYDVFVRNAKGGFDPVKVDVGWSRDGWQEVHAKAIKPGVTVATYGSYELLAAGK